MTVLTIAATSLRRLVRERGNLFFVFVLPLLLILVLGLTVTNDDVRIGIHVAGDPSTTSQDLVEALEDVDDITAVRFADEDEATDALEREDVTALVIIPGQNAAGHTDDPIEVEYLVIPGSGGFEVQSTVRSAIAAQNTAIRAEQLVHDETDLDPDEVAPHVSAVSATVEPIGVVTVDPDGDGYEGADAVGFIAAQELVLFVFLIAMIAASALIKARQLGVTRRMLATPATAREVVVGEAAGRYAVAVVQSGFIIGATALLFGLAWGSWPATAAIALSFALVATAAALFIGAMVDNESQASAIGISLGLAFAALGGCMVPFEIFPDWLRTLAHVTPHAWAVDAFTEVLQRGGGLGDIGVELGVLLLYGLVLLGAASAALRRAIVH